MFCLFFHRRCFLQILFHSDFSLRHRFLCRFVPDFFRRLLSDPGCFGHSGFRPTSLCFRSRSHSRFEPKADWSRKFAPQREIYQYIVHCAKKYQLLSKIQFNTEVLSADFDEQQGLWVIKTNQQQTILARILISGCGQLNRPAYPRLKGMDSFKGEVFHSAQWHHDYDLTGKKVAVANFERQYEKCFGDTSRPYPGVIDGLNALKDKGLRLGCVTNKAEKFTLPLLQRTGLADYFELTLSGDSLPEKKPHPLPMLHAAEFFGAANAEVLLIGDSVNDAEAARAAGSPVFIVPYGYNEGQE